MKATHIKILGVTLAAIIVIAVVATWYLVQPQLLKT